MIFRWTVPVGAVLASCAFGQVGSISVDASKLGAPVSPGLYGVFLEEISHAGEGGLYAELLQNRGFEDANVPIACTVKDGQLIPPRTNHFWEMKPSEYTLPWTLTSPHPGWSAEGGLGKGEIKVVADQPLNANKPHALAVSVVEAPYRVFNEGFWGVPVQNGETYRLRLWAKSESGTPLTARLLDTQGHVLASSYLGKTSGTYRLFEANLKASGTSANGRFALDFGKKGHVWVAYASLFPAKTFRNRPNGLRTDLANMIEGLRPGFVRFPGGCYVEGVTIETRPQWQDTLGPVEQRKPTFSPWGYWNSNGFGYHEWLQFCEDIHAEPLYVFNVGISCAFRSGTFLPDSEVPELIQNTLDAIEYANGPVTSRWGALRAKNGHPKPFGMKYVEIGNEQQGPKYGARVALFYKAIKARYPSVKVILSSWIAGIDRAAINAAGKIDVVDEHAYTPLNWAVWNFNSFAKYPRTVPWELYIGEFACNGGVGSGNLSATLNDAAYMMSMEKNSDLVKMGSYAPLLVNENSPHWDVNMIHFDASRSFGRATYYACKMFAENVPSFNLPTTVKVDASDDEPIQGPIALGSFCTEVEYKNLKVTQGDNTVLENDFSRQADGWTSDRPDAWKVADGAYGQRSILDGDELYSSYGDGYHDVDLTVKVRKIRGPEGFLLSIGRVDGMRVQLNFGGWGNSIHAIQLNSSSALQHTPGHIETGRWYDVHVASRGRSVEAWLDGKSVLKMEMPRSRTVLAIAGLDERAGDLVLKVVNTRLKSTPVDIDLTGFTRVGDVGRAEVLTSANETDENSFDAPHKIVPRRETVAHVGPRFRYVLSPSSLTILRIKSQRVPK